MLVDVVVVDVDVVVVLVDVDVVVVDVDVDVDEVEVKSFPVFIYPSVFLTAPKTSNREFWA